MDILHVERSQPDDLVRNLVEAMSRGKQAREVPLWQDQVDYDQLVKDIFEAEKVICWW